MAAGLLILLNHVKDVGTTILCLVSAHIKQNLGYWWFFDDNIQALTVAVSDLGREKGDMDRKIEAARLNVESATPEVGNWLAQVTQKLEEANTTLQRGNQLQRRDIIPRYLLGKNANKSLEDIGKLRDEGKSITISSPTPPAAMTPIPYEPTTEFESRRRIEEVLVESLKDHHVQMIAVCGAGGVGKTTMVQKIVERVRNQLFEEVVTVVVSQQIDMLKLQKEIAEILDLKFGVETTTLVGRAHKIRTRLLDSKTKLLIFDDVWKSFNLNDIGVPLGLEGCKIILTSRNKDVCQGMDADKVFQLEVLDDEESWRLFKEKSRVCDDDSELQCIAKAVAAECKGLPIALVTIAKALKQKDINTWNDSLLQLKRANPTNFPKLLEDVFMPLKLSYDFLEPESEQPIFLLCCLFPEDYDIPIELLTLYSFGLGILKGIRNIDEGRVRTLHLVGRLKSRFLLIDGFKPDHVKMHDVVRDVAIFIGSKAKNVCLQVSSMDSPQLDLSHDCCWMSIDISNVNAKFRVGPALQSLRLLRIQGSYLSESSDIAFEGMEELKVLYFSTINVGSFSPTQGLLKKLKVLYLRGSTVGGISVVGELTSLEVLCILYCDSIKELPKNFRSLNRLRLLELRGCRELKRVAEGVISSLVGLEELKIVDSFNQWGAKVHGREERNASLSELERLHKLSWLEMDISYTNLVAQQISLSEHLVRYRISPTMSRHMYDMKYKRDVYLRLPGNVITLGNWIHQLVRSTQSLELEGDGSNIFNLDEIGNLKRLTFTNCSTVKELVCKFPMLEQLYLESLEEVESIVDGRVLSFFPKLEVLHVWGLPKLAHLWRSPNQNVSMPNLRRIIIHNCPNIHSLFSLELDVGSLPTNQNVLLPNLEEMTIYDCPKIRYLFSPETATSLVQLRLLQIESCRAIETVLWNETADEIIEFPGLTQLQIKSCPKLRIKIGKCPNLESIRLHGFKALRHLPRTLVRQLRVLTVVKCDTREELFVDEFEDEGHGHVIFPNLEELELGDLPKLVTFYRGIESIKFPKLETKKISGNLARMNMDH